MYAIMENSPFINWLEHPVIHMPFVVAMGGWLLALVIYWGFNREGWIKEGKSPFHELKDEAWILFIVILLSIIWDNQALFIYDYVAEYVFGKEIDSPTELLPEHYMAIAPVTLVLYAVGKWMYLKATKK